MAFNTNYLDTGLFGIYATGMVIPIASSDLNLFIFSWSPFLFFKCKTFSDSISFQMIVSIFIILIQHMRYNAAFGMMRICVHLLIIL